MRGDQSLKWSTRMLQPWLGLPENPPRQNEVISVRNTVNFNQLNRLFHGMRKPQMHFFSCRCGTSTMEKRTGWEPDQRDHVHCCTEQPSGPKVSHSHRDTGLSMPDSSHTYSAGRYVELILLRYCIRVYCMLWRFSHLKSKPGSGPNVFWFFLHTKRLVPCSFSCRHELRESCPPVCETWLDLGWIKFGSHHEVLSLQQLILTVLSQRKTLTPIQSHNRLIIILWPNDHHKWTV